MRNGARFAFHDLAPGEESFRRFASPETSTSGPSTPPAFLFDGRPNSAHRANYLFREP